MGTAQLCGKVVRNFFDNLYVKPSVMEAIKHLEKKGFAVACGRGYSKYPWFESLFIYDTEEPFYESTLPYHLRSSLTDTLSPPLNSPPFNEVPVALLNVSYAKIGYRGVVAGPSNFGRLEVYLLRPERESRLNNLPPFIRRINFSV